MQCRYCMTDTARFTEVYSQYSVAIYRYALHMSGSPAIAEEITHDAFLEYIRRPSGFDDRRGTIGAYLYGIARHILHRYLERSRRFQRLDDDKAEPVGNDNGLLECLTAREDLEALNEEILRLPEKNREVVVLCDLQEMSYEAAATVLGCVVGTVRSRLHRGRALLISRMQARCAV